MLLTYGWQLCESTQTQLHKWNEWLSERTNERMNEWMTQNAKTFCSTKWLFLVEQQRFGVRPLPKMIESHLNVLRLNLRYKKWKMP